MATIKNGVVILNPYEAVAYWWIKRIKAVSEDIKTEVGADFRRKSFSEIFDYEKLKNEGYRNIYLKLSKKIEERCEGRRRFSQRVHMTYGGHNELVTWLSEIMGEEVPNINLCQAGVQDIIVLITKEGFDTHTALVGDVAPSGIRTRLQNKFKPNSVLCEPRKVKPNNQEEPNVK